MSADRSQEQTRVKFGTFKGVYTPSVLDSARQQLESLLQMERMEANVEVLVRSQEEDLFDRMQQSSRQSHLVFLGIRSPEKDESVDSYSTYYATLLEKTADFPPTAMVMASETLDFRRIFE